MLVQSLTNFAKKMDNDFPRMNRGGCAVFAVHIAKRLQHLVPTRIKLIDHIPHDLDAMREQITDPLNILNWYKAGICFVHLIVEFDCGEHTYHFDSEGIRFAKDGLGEFDGYVLSEGSFTIEEVTNFTKAPYRWNTSFDRRHIPAVKRDVKNLFARHINAQRLFKR